MIYYMLIIPFLIFSAVPSLATAPANDQLVIAGLYADADIVTLADGSYLMYFGVEPETPGTNFEIYVASSSDGQNWTRYEEPVLTQATFPDAVQLETGEIRLYFQQAQAIYSAISPTGLSDFAIEDGVRITPQTKLDTNGVAAPTVIQRSDGTYYMIFRGAVSRRYQPTSFNTTTTVFMAATSSDGLNWERQGVVVNGRHPIYDGYIDGPELFYNPAGKLRLRFWAPGGTNAGAIQGQFEKKSNNEGDSWKKRALMMTDILGGDPTYAYINDQLYMYYTVRSEGIYLRIIE